MPYLSPLHPGRVLTTFGFISAIVEALNGWGASYSSNQSLTSNEINIGHGLIKASLLLQIFVAVSFLLLAGIFQRSCRGYGIRNSRLDSPLVTLYISTALIMGRTIYRTVEYFSIANVKFNAPSFDAMSMSPIIRYEWFFYVFEATLMLCNCVLWNFRHPRRWLPKNNKIYLAQDGATEIEGPGYKDPRPLWQTLVDPFDIGGLLVRPGAQQQFWEPGHSEDAASSGGATKTAAAAA